MDEISYNPTTKRDEYFFKEFPSKEILPEAVISNMWTSDEVPSFLLEAGFTRLNYKV